jgi:hypothetical protein
MPSLREHVKGLLRSPSATRKRLLAFAAALALVVGVGMLATLGIERLEVTARAASKAPVIQPSGNHGAPRASAEAHGISAPAALARAALVDEATVSEPPAKYEPALRLAEAHPIDGKSVEGKSVEGKPLRDEPAAAPDSNGLNGVTLARQAVDALLTGDRAKALLHYRELSRRAPEHDVYREAVRRLSPSASKSEAP